MSDHFETPCSNFFFLPWLYIRWRMQSCTHACEKAFKVICIYWNFICAISKKWG